ncbi:MULTISPECIES: sigma factor-like helix-turn-helix DNA-binding protein [unclassified Virgibacillus]|uniref:sigma factor-like helix-turn-helix DNA-binding protein n=1 Tax=unclassified Virgibacillus TaxID=2620237 RepID=UPI0024DE97C1|nr:sigma factor-like helix-turn-helix DNA-binding protein [Virgibacillus sp. LDC-1]
MRYHEKQWATNANQDIFQVDFHRFIELYGDATHMEIAEELGISLGEVKALKKKLNRA